MLLSKNLLQKYLHEAARIPYENLVPHVATIFLDKQRTEVWFEENKEKAFVVDEVPCLPRLRLDINGMDQFIEFSTEEESKKISFNLLHEKAKKKEDYISRSIGLIEFNQDFGKAVYSQLKGSLSDDLLFKKSVHMIRSDHRVFIRGSECDFDIDAPLLRFSIVVRRKRYQILVTRSPEEIESIIGKSAKSSFVELSNVPTLWLDKIGFSIHFLRYLNSEIQSIESLVSVEPRGLESEIFANFTGKIVQGVIYIRLSSADQFLNRIGVYCQLFNCLLLLKRHGFAWDPKNFNVVVEISSAYDAHPPKLEELLKTSSFLVTSTVERLSRNEEKLRSILTDYDFVLLT